MGKKKILLFVAAIFLAFLSLGIKAFADTPQMLKGTNLRAIEGSELVTLISDKMKKMEMVASPKINPLRKFPVCLSDLKMIPVFGGWKTVRIICDDVDGWKTNIRTNLVETRKAEKRNIEGSVENKSNPEKPMLKVVMLTKNLTSGQIISEFDVEMVETGKYISASYFTDISKVIGRKLKSNVKMGSILKSRNLITDWTIVKEQPITIEAKNSSFSVYADGIALGNGFLGDLIKVRNIGSGIEFYAWVASRKKVYPATNISKD